MLNLPPTQFIALVLLATALPGAEPVPRPPCGSAPFPPYPEVGSPPVIQVWERSEWTPPPCTGWSPSGPSTLVATVARFRHSTGAEGLRRRIGAVSAAAGMLYWSTTRQQWQPLVVDAFALSGPAGERRPDFAPDEIVEGARLYLQQQDSLFGKAVYQIRVTAASAERLVFATENHSPLRLLGILVFPPAEVQSIGFLERESKDVWRYYSIARTGPQTSLLAGGHPGSLINRAAASYRYLAGIPMNQEPPAAR
jgi:hypothetical protein